MQASSAESSQPCEIAQSSNSSQILIQIDDVQLIAVLEKAAAPQTCALFCSMLPLPAKLVHCRWSGDAMWAPLQQPHDHTDFENHTSHPKPGQVLLYSTPEFDEPQILIPYGICSFWSKDEALTGNHFLTITEAMKELSEMGRSVLWERVKEITFTLIRNRFNFPACCKRKLNTDC